MTLKEMQKCIQQVCQENQEYIIRRKIPVYFEIDTEEQVYEFTVPGFTRIVRTLFFLSRLCMRKDISAIYIVLYNIKDLMIFQWKFTRIAPPKRQYRKLTEKLLKYAEVVVKQEETGFMSFNDWRDDDNYFRTFHMFFKNQNYKESEDDE